MKAPKSLLFVGDMHFSSRKPSGRMGDYHAHLMEKAEQIIRVANEGDCQPVFLGDIFHRARESDVPVISDVIGMLVRFVRKPVIIAGNHDIDGSGIGERCALRIIQSSGTAFVVDEYGFLDFHLQNGRDVRLHLFPWGCLDADGQVADGAINIGVSHADYGAFCEKPGIEVMINGHEHVGSENQVGNTRWLTPGSIARVGADEMGHKPILTLFDGEQWKTERIKVRPASEVFHASRQAGTQPDHDVESESVEQSVQAFLSALSERGVSGYEKGDGARILQAVENCALELADKSDRPGDRKKYEEAMNIIRELACDV